MRREVLLLFGGVMVVYAQNGEFLHLQLFGKGTLPPVMNIVSGNYISRPTFTDVPSPPEPWHINVLDDEQVGGVRQLSLRMQNTSGKEESLAVSQDGRQVTALCFGKAMEEVHFNIQEPGRTDPTEVGGLYGCKSAAETLKIVKVGEEVFVNLRLLKATNSLKIFFWKVTYAKVGDGISVETVEKATVVVPIADPTVD